MTCETLNKKGLFRCGFEHKQRQDNVVPNFQEFKKFGIQYKFHLLVASKINEDSEVPENSRKHWVASRLRNINIDA